MSACRRESWEEFQYPSFCIVLELEKYEENSQKNGHRGYDIIVKLHGGWCKIWLAEGRKSVNFFCHSADNIVHERSKGS